jgi:hypothetical protein
LSGRCRESSGGYTFRKLKVEDSLTEMLGMLKGAARHRGGQRQHHMMPGGRGRREESARRCVAPKEGKDDRLCDHEMGRRPDEQ